VIVLRVELPIFIETTINRNMPRPRLCGKIMFGPKITYFKTQGAPMRFLEIVELTTEEMEDYRLRHINDLK